MSFKLILFLGVFVCLQTSSYLLAAQIGSNSELKRVPVRIGSDDDRSDAGHKPAGRPADLPFHHPNSPKDNSSFQIGAGIYDITGPAAEVGMMGYAMMGQVTSGINFRLRARAFVFADSTGNRIVFVSTDSCMIFTGVKQKVVEQLQKLYGNMYGYNNVMLSGTHTHSGPAGYAFYLMYDIMSLGFHPENFNTIVNGIVKAIQQAHNNLSSGGKILINSGELLDSNTNRSPSAYQNNPASERAQYKYNVDKLMVLLRLEDQSGKELGMINWFAVHGTSMNNTNTLISGDNKGYASYVFEKTKNGQSSLPGMGPFVAAFAQTNEGDVSPNTKGAFCPDGKPCDDAHSTCNGKSQECRGIGPGKDMFESTQIIGTNQFKQALALYNNASEQLTGSISYVHMFVDMTQVNVSAEWSGTGQTETTCSGALGDSFAAGTTDGPGDFDFKQGTNSSSTNPYWNFIASFISAPTPQEIQCQSPKPILLNTGDVTFPTLWTPAILPLQIFQIGQLVIVGVPGEFTTMSGRRLRNTVRQTLLENGYGNDTVVVIAGLTNAYSHYITTNEEYHIQRYEGASTLYGPFTLPAYQMLYSQLATALAKGSPVPPGPTPPDLTGKTPSFQPGVIYDDTPFFTSFGDVDTDVNPSYSVGDIVTVSFWGASPRNDFRTQDTFLTVEQQVSGNWQVILTDGDFDTQFHWQREDIAESLVTIDWAIGQDTQPGKYRIRTFGTSRDLFGNLTPYTGTSSTFTVQ